MSQFQNNFEIDWSTLNRRKPSNKTTEKKYFNQFSHPVRRMDSKRDFHKIQNEKPAKTANIFIGLLFVCIVGFMLFLSISVSYAAPVDNEKQNNNTELFANTMDDELKNYFITKERTKPSEKKLNYEIKTIQYNRYRVKKDDSLQSIAAKFGIHEDTIILINQLKNRSSLKAGLTLEIPNQDGRRIQIKPNDSIYKIARRYSVNWEKIADVNNLKKEELNAGSLLFIPDSRMTQFEKEKFYQSNEFLWPVKGKISSYFGPRVDPFNGGFSYHSGLDIRNHAGTPVYSAMPGKVIYTGFDRLYGNHVIVRHANGLKTRYAHLRKILVKKGAAVHHTVQLGEMGSTGRSTGPHLHFEVIKNGKSVDPLKYLKM